MILHQGVLGELLTSLQHEEIGVLLHAGWDEVLQRLHRIVDPVERLETTIAVLVAKNYVGSWGDPTNAKVTLTPGWHRWEARVGDNTGGYGPNNDKNKYWTLSYVAPDDSTEKQWIETNAKYVVNLDF